MQGRELRTARAAGTPPKGVHLLGRAYALAMEPRLRAEIDDHHPDFLHPGRSALILLIDTGEARPEVLAAVMLTETERPAFAPERARIVAALGAGTGERVAAITGNVPPPDAEDLAERLLLAHEDVQRVALAERLDHLRHAHLWPDVDERRRAHRQADEVYAGIAARVHPTLARRYARWCENFGRSHLR
jgi:(p)ppGpp synthase/HD superfamily hydrolase